MFYVLFYHVLVMQDVADIIPDDFNPPTSDVTALLGWLVALLLAALWWGVRTREREHKDNLETWKDIAHRRADALERARTAHMEAMNTERQRYESMVKEVTEVMTGSASVLERLREDLNDHNDQHGQWRIEVRETHERCLAEIRKLAGGTEPSTEGPG